MAESESTYEAVRTRSLNLFRTVLEDDDAHIEDAVAAVVAQLHGERLAEVERLRKFVEWAKARAVTKDDSILLNQARRALDAS